MRTRTARVAPGPQVATLIDSYRQPTGLSRQNWSGRRDSNPRPQRWQRCALPIELLPQYVETFSPQTTFTSRFYPVFILAADHLADVLSAGYGLVPYRTGQERRTSSSCACLSCLVFQKFRPKKQNPGILVEIPGR